MRMEAKGADKAKAKKKAEKKAAKKPKAQDKARKKKAKADEKAKSKSARKNGAKKAKKSAGPTMAQLADRHDLYERSVQDTVSDMDFLVRAWHEIHGDDEHPLHFREDFCGTAAMCAEWIRRRPDATAEGFDIDSEVLAWGRARHLDPLGDDASRVTLHQEDVREPGERRPDIRCAHNFSYQILSRRADLKDYFVKCRESLSGQGIFVIDTYGGSESFIEMEEQREIEEGAFTYRWEQRSFHPATGRMQCFIHFEFPDGSKLEEAFEYTWRLYTPPELRDILFEAGFREVRTYFEEFDDEGDGTGDFARDEEGPACEGWIGYMVAVP